MNAPEKSAAIRNGYRPQPSRPRAAPRLRAVCHVPREGQDRAQNRSDAWSPAEGEGEAHDVGRCEACRSPFALEPRLPGKERDPDHAEEIQSHQNDDEPGRDRQRLLPRPEQSAQGRGPRAQCGEDGREAKHEGKRRTDQGDAAPSGCGTSLAEVFDAHPGHVTKIRRHERQDARRQKRQRPCAGGAQISDVDCHQRSILIRLL